MGRRFNAMEAVGAAMVLGLVVVLVVSEIAVRREHADIAAEVRAS